MKEEEKDKKEKKNRLKNWAVFSGIAFQMGGTIFVCAWIGKKLDEQYPMDRNWFTLGFVLFGLIASVVAVLQQLKHFDK